MPIHLGWVQKQEAVYAQFEGVITDQDWFEFDNHLVWDYLNTVTAPIVLVVDCSALEHLPSIATLTRLRAGSHHRLNHLILTGVQNKSHSLILKRIAALFRLRCEDAERIEKVSTSIQRQPASTLS